MNPDVNRCITRIEPQKKNSKRFSVFLDDEFAFGLDQIVVLECHLHEGDDLTPAAIEKVLRCEAAYRAKEKALRLIAYRPRSVAEIKKRLKETGADPTIIEQVTEDLIRVGLLDDTRFAEAYVQTRMISKPVSRRLMERELRAKGTPQQAISSAIETIFDRKSDQEIARELIHKKARQYAGQDLLKVRKKLSDFLARRGFGWDVIRTVVREVMKDWKEES